MSALNAAARAWGRAAVYTGRQAREGACGLCGGSQLVPRRWLDGRWTADVCSCAGGKLIGVKKRDAPRRR